MKKRFLIYIITIFLILNLKSAYSEIFIKAKVNNQIITNFDVKNEKIIYWRLILI